MVLGLDIFFVCYFITTYIKIYSPDFSKRRACFNIISGCLIIVMFMSIRIIFDLYANENLGVRAIAKILSESGLRNTNGNPFSFSTIKGILVNPKYKGFYCGNKTHKVHFLSNEIAYVPKNEWVMYENHEKVPPIVSAQLWDKANRKLKERSEKMV